MVGMRQAGSESNTSQKKSGGLYEEARQHRFSQGCQADCDAFFSEIKVHQEGQHAEHKGDTDDHGLTPFRSRGLGAKPPKVKTTTRSLTHYATMHQGSESL